MLVHGPVKMALFKVLSTTDLFQASRMLASMVVSASKATHTAIIRSITKVRNAILVLIAWFVYVHIKRGMQFGLRQKCSHARENWWNDQRNIYWNSWLKYFIGVHCRILFWTWIENVMHVSYWVNYHIGKCFALSQAASKTKCVHAATAVETGPFSADSRHGRMNNYDVA